MAEVLPAMADGPQFSHAPLRSSASHTSFFDPTAPYSHPRRNSYSHTDLRSPSLRSPSSSSADSSFHSTPASSLSLDPRCDDLDHDCPSPNPSDDFDPDDDDGGGLLFPAYSASAGGLHHVPPPSPIRTTAGLEPVLEPVLEEPASPTSTPDPLPISEDDTAVRIEPSHHVDYLSHEWKEEDIWSSWRHIVEHRKVYGERSRLENASWRTWAKSQFKLKTVSPETLNWLKDVDVTWLYGPLQPHANRTHSHHTSEPVSRLSKCNSFLHKKPILKKRSMSEVMLQNSLSSSSLVKQAAAAVQAQQVDGAVMLERRRMMRPVVGRATSDFVTSSIPSRTTSRDPTDYFSSRSTSGLQTPADQAERKHIRFDDKVEQCIAVECKDADDDDEEDFNHNPWAKYREDSSSSDEGVVMMKKSRKRRPLSRSNSRSSFSGESKTIAKLPSTTLKYRTDSPDVTEQQPTHSLGGFWRSSRLSPSPSQETLRPSNPSANFLLPDDEEEQEPFKFRPGAAYEGKRASTPTPSDAHGAKRPSTPPAESSGSGGLRRTESGMFMPFDDEDDEPPPPGILGRVVDTVNTARDIAHVIWNVGWRN